MKKNGVISKILICILSILFVALLVCCSIYFDGRKRPESGEKQENSQQEQQEASEETAETEQPRYLPEVIFSQENYMEYLLELAFVMQESGSKDFLTTGMSEEDVQAILDLTAVDSAVMKTNIYMQYYIAQVSYKATRVDYEDGESYITLDVTPEYYEDCVPYEQIAVVRSQKDVYEAYTQGFQTGFEPVVMCVQGDALDEAGMIALVEQAAWDIGEQLPLLFKNINHHTYVGEPGQEYLFTVELDYDSYGITLQDQLEAQRLVTEKVDAIAQEILSTTEDPAVMCEQVYKRITEAVEFDYELGTALDDVLTSTDPYIGIERGIYGALIDGKSVCSGYASAFKAVCDELGIPCMVVLGYAEDNDHAWNMVLLEDRIVYFDPTWGDSAKWYKSYLYMSQERMDRENRRIYDTVYIPQEYLDMGYIRKDTERLP